MLPLPPGAVIPTSVSVVVLGTTWEAQELAGLHAPDSASNVQALSVWAQSEGVVQDNNPLASSGDHPGATHCLAQCVPVHGVYSPVYAYDSLSDGAAANVAFLQGSNYDGVRAAFRASAGLMGIFRAINQSKWCASCQGGLYPIDLYRAARSMAAPQRTVVAVTAPLP